MSKPHERQSVWHEKHLLHSIFGTALYSQIVNDKQVILVKAGNKLRPVLREHPGQAVQNGGKVRHQHRHILVKQMVGIEWRYLANIENQGAIPSLPVMIQLIKVCGLPVERYFNPEIMREESAQRQRVSHKLKLCPEQYLPIIEGAIDGALKMEQTAKQKEDA